MGTKQQYKSKGFTIIETLIVLAIAATIFLVVFLAVTALDRSSRNTTRKDDAAAVLAAVGDYVSNNGGNLPSEMTLANGSLTICSNSDTACNGSTDAPSSAKVSSYTGVGTVGQSPPSNDITIYTASGGTAISSGSPAANNGLIIDEGSSCSSASAAQKATNSNSYVVMYGIETGTGSYAWQCIGS